MTPDQHTAHQIDHLYRAEADRVFVFEDTDSVRSPGWFRAQCHECEWETSGSETVVKDAVREHVGTHPLGRLLAAVSDAVRERGEKLAKLPDTLAAIWAQLPGTNWALWGANGALAISRRLDTPVTGAEAVVAFGWPTVPLVPPRMAEPYTIAEFTDERWRELQEAIASGGDTSLSRWVSPVICDAVLGSTGGRVRCELPVHGPQTLHRSTKPDGQARTWSDNENEVAGFVEVGHSDTGVQWGTGEREWPANP